MVIFHSFFVCLPEGTQIRSQRLEDRYCHQSGKFWWALGGFELQGCLGGSNAHMADSLLDVAGSWRQHGDHLWDTRAGFCCTIQHLIICNLAIAYRISLIAVTSLACEVMMSSGELSKSLQVPANVPSVLNMKHSRKICLSKMIMRHFTTI